MPIRVTVLLMRGRRLDRGIPSDQRFLGTSTSIGFKRRGCFTAPLQYVSLRKESRSAAQPVSPDGTSTVPVRAHKSNDVQEKEPENGNRRRLRREKERKEGGGSQ